MASADKNNYSSIGHEERLLVLDLNPSTATRLFIEALKKRLQGIVLNDIMKHDLDADANASGKVLVICNNHTRIDSVLQPILELNCHDRKTLLLVLFQCEKENKFKKVESLSLMKSNYPQIDDIVQIGFDNKRGIYDCEFNDVAISCIEVFAGKEPKKQHEQNKQNEKGLFYKIKDMIFKSSDKKPNQVDTRKAPSIKELTEGVKRALDLVKFEPDGSKVIVCQIAMKELEEEFRHLINAFQRNPEGDSSGALQDILNYACELKSMATDKESKQTCEVMKSTISAGVEQDEVQQTDTNDKNTKTVTVDAEQSATTKSAGEKRDGLPQNKSNDRETKTETVYAQPAAIQTNSAGVEQDELQQTDSNDKNNKTVTVDAEQSAITKSAGEEQDGLKHDESNDKETRTVTADIQQTATKFPTFDERNGSDNSQSTDKKLQTHQLTLKQSVNELNTSQKTEPKCEEKETTVSVQPRPLKDDQAIDPLSSLETISSIKMLKAKLEENGFDRVMSYVHVFYDDDLTGSNVMCINDSRLQGERSDRILLAVVNCEKNRFPPFSSPKSELKVCGDLGLFHEVLDSAFGKDDMAGVIYNCEMNKVFELVEKGMLGSKQTKACDNKRKQKTK